MIVYRLAKSKYSRDLSGKGAEIAGGRWNSKGNAVLYTSDSRALCTAEIAVHTPLGIVPANFELITIEISDASECSVVKPEVLPENWHRFPFRRQTQVVGDQFLKDNENLLLKVPSAVVQGAFNYLLNPAHKNFSEMVSIVNVEVFNFDPRLFGSSE